MNENQHCRLWSILRKYKKVFDNDISEGYNNESGEFDVDWYWLNDQQPPPGVSKQEKKVIQMRKNGQIHK